MTPLFNTIAVEIAALCNRSCVFCPNHTTQRPDEFMDMKLVTKILTELGQMKYSGRLEYFIYNEPTRDKRLIEILELTRTLCPKARPAINTNGDYFKSAKHIERLFDAGLCQMVINVYSAMDGVGTPEKTARGIATARKREATLRSWCGDVPDLQMDDHVYDKVPRGSRHARIEPKYGVTPQTMKLGAQFQVTNRSGLIQWFAPPLAKPLEKMCVKPWRIFNINWRGEALVCCNDYFGEHSVGNANEQTVEQLWNSPKMNAYRLTLQNKRRDTPLCQKCDDKGGYYQHMIAPVSVSSSARKRVLDKTGAAMINQAMKETK